MQRKAAKNDDEAQMWKSWLQEGTATVNRWKWKLEDGDLNGTVSTEGCTYMGDRGISCKRSKEQEKSWTISTPTATFPPTLWYYGDRTSIFQETELLNPEQKVS